MYTVTDTGSKKCQISNHNEKAEPVKHALCWILDLFRTQFMVRLLHYCNQYFDNLLATM